MRDSIKKHVVSKINIRVMRVLVDSLFLAITAESMPTKPCGMKEKEIYPSNTGG